MYQHDDGFAQQATPKQHLKLEFMEKLSNTEIELKKSVAYKKRVYTCEFGGSHPLFFSCLYFSYFPYVRFSYVV